MSWTPPPPDSRPLLDRVRDIWERDLDKLPVYKDLPRLAGGFEIVDGNTKRTVIITCTISIKNTHDSQ